MFTTSAIASREKELHCNYVREQSVKAVPMHWHNEYEITYAEKGSFRIFVEGMEYEIPEGHAILVRGGEKHFYFSNTESCIEAITFLIPSDSAIAERLANMGRFTEHWRDADVDSFRTLFRNFSKAYSEEDDAVAALRMRAAVLDIISLFADKNINVENTFEPRSDDDEKILARLEVVLKYISENYDKTLTLPMASSVAGYVPTYFSRIFKECTGMTFYEYLTSYRLAMSEKLLADKKKRSIVEIAQGAGFGSVKTFDRVFKAKMGISPLKYRKKCLEAAKKR